MEGIQPYAFEPVRRHVIRREFISECDESSSDDGYIVKVRVGNTLWCQCGCCRSMASEKESICYHEISQLDIKIEGKSSTLLLVYSKCLGINGIFVLFDILRW